MCEQTFRASGEKHIKKGFCSQNLGDGKDFSLSLSNIGVATGGAGGAFAPPHFEVGGQEYPFAPPRFGLPKKSIRYTP